VYQDAKRAACEALLKNKGHTSFLCVCMCCSLTSSVGALSHHHGVGYEHLPWMPKYFDETSLKLLRNLKAFLDPKSICSKNNLFFFSSFGV
jgi:hypothetical protein